MTTNYHVQLEGVTKHWVTVFRTGSEQEAIEQCRKDRKNYPSSNYRVIKITQEIIKC